MAHCKSTVKQETHCKNHCKYSKKCNIIQCVTVILQCSIVKLQCIYNVFHCKFTMCHCKFTMVHCKSTVKEETHCKTHCKFCKKCKIIQCVTVNLQCSIVQLQCIYSVSHCKFTVYIFFFTMVLQCVHCKRIVKLYSGFYNGFTMVPL